MTEESTESAVLAPEVQEALAQEEEGSAAAVEAEPVHCRWCGQQGEPGESEDWLCEHCGRYQDAMTCPTCKQIARVSLMPAEMVPEAHAPARRRKAREG